MGSRFFLLRDYEFLCWMSLALKRCLMPIEFLRFLCWLEWKLFLWVCFQLCPSRSRDGPEWDLFCSRKFHGNCLWSGWWCLRLIARIWELKMEELALRCSFVRVFFAELLRFWCQALRTRQEDGPNEQFIVLGTVIFEVRLWLYLPEASLELNFDHCSIRCYFI